MWFKGVVSEHLPSGQQAAGRADYWPGVMPGKRMSMFCGIPDKYLNSNARM